MSLEPGVPRASDRPLCGRGVSQEKDGQISSAIVSSVQSKITQVRGLPPSHPVAPPRGRAPEAGGVGAAQRGEVGPEPWAPRELSEARV